MPRVAYLGMVLEYDARTSGANETDTLPNAMARVKHGHSRVTMWNVNMNGNFHVGWPA